MRPLGEQPLPAHAHPAPGAPTIHAGAWPRPPPLPPQHQPEGRERPHSRSQHRLSLPACRGQALRWATRDSTRNPGRRKPLRSLYRQQPEQRSSSRAHQSTDDWLKMCYIHAMGCDSAIKKTMKQCHLQRYRWAWRIPGLVKSGQRKINTTWYHLYVQSKT